ncbi:hypothetical protein ACMYR2_2910 [Nitrobacter sp. TKz-YC01]
MANPVEQFKQGRDQPRQGPEIDHRIAAILILTSIAFSSEAESGSREENTENIRLESFTVSMKR